MNHHIILCGGSGTRLWPLSRTLLPKQFVPLVGDQSLFQDTISRNRSLFDGHMIVTSTDQYFLAVDQIDTFDKKPKTQYVLESAPRNTAPAITLACLALNEDDIVLITPSDHIIKDQGAYEESVQNAITLAKKDHIVTFGITPTFPSTGFGYIEADGQDVRSFHEKPDQKTAQSYIDSGRFFWNSGMFCFKVKVLLQELQKYQPALLASCKNAYENASKSEFIRIKKDDMQKLEKISIDYAVMEKTERIKMVKALFDWSDLGSYDAVDTYQEKDEFGNVIDDQLISVDAKNNSVVSSDRKIALIDVENLIVVDTKDALLICQKGSSEKVKEILPKVKEIAPELLEIHPKAYRPWGSYEVLLEEKDHYKIKRITVKPGQRLSLQKHEHRNEHWVVVKGLARVTIDQDQHDLKENESIYIKKEQVHRLENIGTEALSIIEVQVGAYVGEDDIIRLKDDYQRLSDELHQ